MNLEVMMHRLWGSATESPSYDKRAWSEFQDELMKMAKELIDAKKEVSHYMGRALAAEKELRPRPVIGECEECGHSIVTPLKRL